MGNLNKLLNVRTSRIDLLRGIAADTGIYHFI